MKNLLTTFTFIIFYSSLTQAQQAGSLDLSFDGDGKLITNIGVSATFKNRMKVSVNGKIIAVGIYVSGGNFLVATRFNQDGSLDNTFGTNGVFNSTNISGLQTIYDLVILSDNSIIVLAYSNNAAYYGFIIKITSNGTIDTSFGTSGIIRFSNFFAKAMELQSNGKIVIGGDYFTGSVFSFKIIRLNPNSTYDLSFGNDGINNNGITITYFGLNEYFKDFTIDKDEKIILLGSTLVTPNFHHLLAKYNTDGSLDTNFGTNGKLILTPVDIENYNSPISPSTQSDKQIVVVGSGDVLLIYRLSKNGVVDKSYGINGIVSSATLGYPFDTQMQSDDKILVLTVYLNQMCVARLNANGSLDTSFDTDGVQCISFSPSTNNAQPFSVVIQADGKIIFGGFLGPRFAFVRLHGVSNFTSNQGKVPTQFNTNNEVANAIALRAGGKPIVVGNVTNAISPTSGSDFGIVAYNADGGLDYTFGSNGFVSISFDADDRANAVAVQTNGKILVAGKAANGSNYDLVIVRYNTDGTLDNTFGIAGIATLEIDFFNSEATSIALQTDGKIVVTGLSQDRFNDGFYAILAHFNANGFLDNTFGTNGVVDLPAGNGYVGKSVALQSDGKTVVACASQSSVGNFVVVRCNANGNMDNTFDTDGKVSTNVGTESSFAKSLVLQSDNKIMVCGAAKENSQAVFAMLRYTINGSLDNSFDADGIVLTNFSPIYATANAVAIQPDGKIFLTGNTTITTNADIVLARYSSNGVLDPSFNYSGKLILPFGYGNEGVNAIISNANGVAYLAGFYHNGHDNDFAMVKIVDCKQYIDVTLENPSDNYPNSLLSNPIYGKSINASNIINVASNVTYKTNSSVMLNPGFQANIGSVLRLKQEGVVIN